MGKYQKMKSKSYWVIAVISIVLVVVGGIFFEKFQFNISNGNTKIEIKSERKTEYIQPKKDADVKNTTEGNQSPIVNNISGAPVTINYGKE